MALGAAAESYFRSMNPIASKIYEDIDEAKNSYETIWDTLTDKEKAEIINESIIKPEIALKYALLETLDFDINDPPVRKDDLMSFFGREHGQRIIQDENGTYKDEHSAPFLYQTRSQLNLCVLSEHRGPKEAPASPQPVLTELAMSHSKVVSELKNALKSHDVLKSTFKEPDRECTSPSNKFLSKFIGNFKARDEERECLVPSSTPSQIVASSDNFFRTNFKSPVADTKLDKEYRCSVLKSCSDVSEENRGLLSSQASSTDFQSTDTLTESPEVPKTGYDFLDNW